MLCEGAKVFIRFNFSDDAENTDLPCIIAGIMSRKVTIRKVIELLVEEFTEGIDSEACHNVMQNITDNMQEAEQYVAGLIGLL